VGADTSPARPGLSRPGVAAAAIAIFIALGLPDGMLGAVWPAMRADLGLPIDALGVLLMGSSAGFLASSVLSGMVVGRLGVRRAVLVAAASTLAGSLAIASGSLLLLLAAGAVVLGACAGVLDPCLSAAASVQNRHRLVNLLHGGYGFGAALAPLLVTAAIAAGTWRAAYAALVLLECAITAWWATATAPDRDNLGLSAPTSALKPINEPTSARLRSAGREPAAYLGMAAFFFAGGLEIAAGAWAATYLRDLLGLSAGLTGAGVFAYWASLTASRVAAGALPHRRGPRQLVVAGSLAATAGAALLWWRPDHMVAVAGLLVAGCGLGPVYPGLTSLTPSRVGRSLAARLIGWQLGAGAVGSAVLPSAVGVGLQHGGLGLTGPLLTALALVTVVVTIALDRVSRQASGGDHAGSPARR
jgi:fucose permease